MTMTNADRIRKMGDTDMTHFIVTNFKDIKKCKYCAVGIDNKNVCRDPEADCEEEIFNYLGKESD